MKRLLILLGMVLCLAQGHAQTRKKSRMHDAFEKFRQEVYDDFENFRRKCMEEFIEFTRNPWKEFEEKKPIPVPEKETVPPVTVPEEDRDKPQEDKPVVIEEVVAPVVVEPQPTPVEPIEEVPVEEEKFVDFTFFGTPARVRFDRTNLFTLRGVDENSVADALKILSGKAYDNLMIDCLALRDELKLSDWAYIQMLKAVAETIVGRTSNEATLLLTYLYVQSGYKARMATDGLKLYLLYASKYEIYNQSSFTIDGDSYYGLIELPARLFICQVAFPKERELSLGIFTDQRFSDDASKVRTLRSLRHPEVQCTAHVNGNLLDFYNSYPTSMYGGNFMTRWAMYANTPMSEDAKMAIYPELRKHIEGKTPLEAVTVLLDFVQWAFVYEYDEKVWGHDRAFFAEETLAYPYADCEDRSILFSRLVRDLVGLKVVLVYYPGHLATAVHFTTPVTGDYLMLQGQRYVICDPTYFGAAVGQTMKGMDNQGAKAILLD